MVWINGLDAGTKALLVHSNVCSVPCPLGPFKAMAFGGREGLEAQPCSQEGAKGDGCIRVWSREGHCLRETEQGQAAAKAIPCWFRWHRNDVGEGGRGSHHTPHAHDNPPPKPLGGPVRSWTGPVVGITPPAPATTLPDCLGGGDGPGSFFRGWRRPFATFATACIRLSGASGVVQLCRTRVERPHGRYAVSVEGGWREHA